MSVHHLSPRGLMRVMRSVENFRTKKVGKKSVSSFSREGFELRVFAATACQALQ